MTRLALALSLDVPGSVRGGGAPVAAIVISASTTAENSTAGTTVGTLSTVLTTGTAVFSLVDNAGSRFALSGAIVQRGATALDYETATYHNIIVSVTGVTPTIANTTLTINVTNIAEVPVNSVAPLISPTTGIVGTVYTCGTGTWSNTPTSYAYQWMLGGVNISGATSSTYTAVLADDLGTLTCKVLASNADGPAAGYITSSNSASVGVAVTYLIDAMSVGAARAYSARKLRSAYAGSAIRVRRSSDNSEQDIGFSGENLDTSALTTFVGANDGFVVTIYDQSGNADNATQATAANQPKIVSAGTVVVKNTKSCLLFDYTNDRLNAGVAVASKETNAVAAYTGATYAYYDGLLSSAGMNYLTGEYGTTHFYVGPPGSRTWYVNNVTTMTTPMSGTLFQARATSAVAPTGANLLIIGFDGAGSYWNGHIGEILVWADQLSGGDATTLYDNQKAYWGTP